MTRLAQFMARIATETYPEPISEGHDQITRLALNELLPKLPPGAKVLDVGCGQGPALRIFRQHKINAIGITTNNEDLAACANAGMPVRLMDQNDLDFPDASFDLVWARHVLEHSIAPLWTLTEFHRVLKPGGLLYAEMPAPGTACAHHLNKNHYSVLGANEWAELMRKAGFAECENYTQLNIQTPAGPDTYFSFTCRKL